ncbi:MAG: hypothetical protein E6H77_03545 [Betaproteobacteria bacterium]|nr:MAG: hypothetical protein E6H77_03545 [Betaproteobacteria bacterium]
MAHAPLVVRRLEAHRAVEDHHGAKMLHADVRHRAVVGRIRPLVRDADNQALDVVRPEAVLA